MSPLVLQVGIVLASGEDLDVVWMNDSIRRHLSLGPDDEVCSIRLHPFLIRIIFLPLEPAGIVPATHNQLVRLRPSHPKEYVLTSLVPERVTRASWNLSFKVASVYQMLPSMIRGPHRMWIRSCMVRGKLPDSIMHPMRFLDVKKVSTSPHRHLGGAGILSTLPS